MMTQLEINITHSEENVQTGLSSTEIESGAKRIEAITLKWSRNDLKVTYACIFFIFFLMSLQQQVHSNIVSFVTSSFVLLPLTGTISIISSVIGGVFRLPTGKFIDIIGRPEGLTIMTIFTTVGIIMMAITKNVQTYAAAQVFYWIGFDGMAYVIDVFMADTSSPKNRALVFAFSNMPYIITTFIGPKAAASYLKKSGWPWAYGTFAILAPAITSPLLYILFRNEWKARKTGLLSQNKSGRTMRQCFSHYFFEFDVIGLILLCAAIVLILLPFSLASYQIKGWRSVIIITMIIISLVCFISFAIWEKAFTPVNLLPFKLLLDPSVWGPCFLTKFIFISFYLWDSNFLPFLQAVHNLSITEAGYISNIYSIGSCFWALIFAVLIRITGRFKYLAMAHLVLEVLGVGLMVNFRHPSSQIGFVVMCQIFIAFGSGGLLISVQMAVIAACPQETVAIPMALIALFSSIGGAIGTAISGAIFTNKFPQVLNEVLPGNATLNALLYGNLEVQLSYPIGTPERNGVLCAYGEAMRYQTYVGVFFLVPCFIFIFVWKDFKIKEMKIAKGVVL